MKILSIGSAYNCQTQNQNEGNVNFGAWRFKPADYETAQKEFGNKSMPLTSLIHQFGLTEPLADVLGKWLPGHFKDASGAIKTNGEDVLFVGHEVAKVRTIKDSFRHPDEPLSPQRIESIKAAIQQRIDCANTYEAMA
jgi:hypothetical protein